MAQEITESEKNKFFKRFGCDRATRNVIAYGIFGVSNIGLLSVGAMTGGAIPVGYAVANVVMNSIAGFLKTNKNMDNVLEENKLLKDNLNKLIDTKSMSNNGSMETPSDVLACHGVNLPDDQ